MATRSLRGSSRLERSCQTPDMTDELVRERALLARAQGDGPDDPSHRRQIDRQSHQEVLCRRTVTRSLK